MKRSALSTGRRDCNPATRVDTRWRPTAFSGGGGTEAGAISPHDSNTILLNSDMSGVFISRDGGETWRMLPFQQMQACPSCAPAFHPADPRVIYAAYGYAAELRVTRDGGETWAPLSPTAPDRLRCIAVDPLQPERILAGCQRGAALSDDGGRTWRWLPGIDGTVKHAVFCRSRATEARPLWVVTDQALYRSSDGGRTSRPFSGPWNDAVPVGFAASVAGDTATTLYLWTDVSGKGTLWVSCDTGGAWERCPEHETFQPHAGGSWGSLLANDTDPATLIVVRQMFSATGSVWRSDDRGRTWRSLAVADRSDPRCNMAPDYVNLMFQSTPWDITHAALDPKDADHLMFAHYCTGYLTRDGGRTWRSQSIHPAPGQDRLHARSRWLNNGLNITTTWSYAVDPFDAKRHFVAYTDIGLAESSDDGVSWVLRRDICVNTYELVFDPAVPGRLWAAFGQIHDIPNNNIILGIHGGTNHGTVGYTEDGGSTWLDLTTGETVNESNFYRPDYGHGWRERNGLPPATVISVAIDPRSSPGARVVYASLWERGVYRSADGGRTWEPRCDGLGDASLPPRCLRVLPHADGTLFCLLTTRRAGDALTRAGVGLYHSIDDGRAWTELTADLDVRWTTDFTVDPRDSRVVYLSVADHLVRAAAERYEGEYAPAGGLYKTGDGGQTWKRIARKCSRHFAATLHPQRPDWVYMTVHAATPEDRSPTPEASLWLSRDGGVTWDPFRDYPFGNPCRVHFHPKDDHTMFVTSYGGSVYRGPIEP